MRSEPVHPTESHRKCVVLIISCQAEEQQFAFMCYGLHYVFTLSPQRYLNSPCIVSLVRWDRDLVQLGNVLTNHIDIMIISENEDQAKS